MKSTYASFTKELNKDEKIELADEIFQLDKEILESQVKLTNTSSQLKNEIKYKTDQKNEKQMQYLEGKKEVDITAYPLKDYKNNKLVYLGFSDLEPVYERELYTHEMQSSFEDNLSFSNNEIDQMRDELNQGFDDDYGIFIKLTDELVQIKAFILDFIFPNEELKDIQIELELNINSLLEDGLFRTCLKLIEHSNKNDIQRKSLFDIPMSREVIEAVVKHNGGITEEIVYEEYVDEENEFHFEHIN